MRPRRAACRRPRGSPPALRGDGSSRSGRRARAAPGEATIQACSGASPAGEHMGARAPRSGEGEPAGDEKRRIGDDEVGFAVASPAARRADARARRASTMRTRSARPLSAAFSPASAASPGSISTRSARASGQRCSSARPTAPTPGPTSTIRRAGAPAAAASKTASGPTRCPERTGSAAVGRREWRRGCVSAITQVRRQAGLAQQPARALHLVRIDQNAPAARSRAIPRPRSCADRRRKTRLAPGEAAPRSAR